MNDAANLMTPPGNESITEIINDILDQVRQENGLKELELAVRYEVDRSTVYRWRKGDVGKAAAILIPLIIAKYNPQSLQKD